MSENSFAEVEEGAVNNQSSNENVVQNENIENQSVEKATNGSWAKLEAAFKNKTIVKGVINDSTKGGYSATVEGESAFLPGSQVDVSPVTDISEFQNKELDFLVTKIDVRRKNLVVSRRATMEEQEPAVDKSKVMAELEEGQIRDGVVKNITDFGAFVDIGGVDGLLHVSDMSWQSVRDPKDIVSRGQKIQVKVLRVERDRNRIALGLKQLDPNGRPEGAHNSRGDRNDRAPRKSFERVSWSDMAVRFPVGTEYDGTITGVKEFGYFVKIANGVEGLVHVSAMGDEGRNFSIDSAKSVGDTLKVKVLSVDSERRRMSLGFIGVEVPAPRSNNNNRSSDTSWASASAGGDYFMDDSRGNNSGRGRRDRGSFTDSRFGNKDNNFRGNRSKRRNDEDDRW
jgi:small subunit ribosomal protein S1